MVSNWKSDAYSKYVSAFKGYTSTTERQAIVNRLNALVEPHLKEVERGSAVDIGTGQGQLMEVLIALGFEVRGVELSHQQAEVALAIGLDVEVCDGLEYLLKLSSQSINLVTCFDVLEHLNKQQLANWMKEIHRVLKPNGVFLGHVPNGLSLFSGSVYWGDLTHEWCPVPESIEMLCKLSDLEFLGCYENLGCSDQWKGRLRFSAWLALKKLYSFLYAIETGNQNSSRIWSRVMLFKAKK